MSKPGIVLYLHVHQPWRVRRYSIFDTSERHDYFNESDHTSERNNQFILEKVADKSYRPMNGLLEKLLYKHPEFKISLSITGTFIEQCEQWAPDVLASFQRLVRTGQVEIVAETYYHSLAFFYSLEEFERQVALHEQKIQTLFGVKPTAFRNTELAYNDQLAEWAANRGYRAILAEGWDKVLGWRSPNYLYQPTGQKLGLLLKNYRLSDDIAFRFSDKNWPQYPLSADTFTDWAATALNDGPLVNLFMDYETFGEHQWQETGIFAFFEHFIERWLDGGQRTFYTVSDAASAFTPAGEISMPDTVTWADSERDLTAWLGNSMQQEVMRYLYLMENDILRTGDLELVADWRKLLTSDHVYYMCTKWFRDGDVHAYFSPYNSPYDAFLYVMNAVRDLRYRLMAYHDTGGVSG